MDNLSKPSKGSFLCYALLLVFLFHHFQDTHAQQKYIDNMQLNCFANDRRTLGFICNASRRCRTYLTFRATKTYNSSASIARLLSAERSEIARINDISDHDGHIIPLNNLVIVPANCSCYGLYYQHNSSYVLQDASESYFTIANATYQGLTTCRSLIDQNSQNYTKLNVGMKIKIPLRCACPTSKQTDLGFKYLLSYLVAWSDGFESIANRFNVDLKSIFDANELSSDNLIFPVTPLLIPLKSEPTFRNTAIPSPPSPPELPVLRPSTNQRVSSSKKWAFVGAGVGIGLPVGLGLFGFLVWFFCYRRNHGTPHSGTEENRIEKFDHENSHKAFPEAESKSWPEEVKHAVQSLKVHKYEALDIATGSFAEGNRIKGSVFRGNLNGNYVAVKMMEGNALGEINVIKKIDHPNVIRPSGVCLHEGNTYVVYEYAERGTLRDLLNNMAKEINGNDQLAILSWKQRIQIAYDVANALNYLHNFVNPPCIHQNLNSSNILLDACLRAKLVNFALSSSTSCPEIQNEDEVGLQLHFMRHIRGTQGYMFPRYFKNGLVTPKQDVFAFGVVILELLSGTDATDCCSKDNEAKAGEDLLYVTINQVLDGENIREKLWEFLDPCLRREFPLGMAYSMAQLARKCLAIDLDSQPTMSEVFITMSNILSATLDWYPSD